MSTETYLVVTTEDDGVWLIVCPQLPGVVSEAKSRVEVAGMARDAIALMLDVAPSSFDLEIRESDLAEWQTVVDDTAARQNAHR